MIKKENLKYYGKEWKIFSKLITKNYDKICPICSRKKKYLTIHHKDRNAENNKLENLQVCCPKCHFREEWKINSGFNKADKIQLKFL